MKLGSGFLSQLAILAERPLQQEAGPRANSLEHVDSE
jgi:hypothetical protein